MILCFSGGLDSLIAWHYLGMPPSIYFTCSGYAGAELTAIKALNPQCLINSQLNFPPTVTGAKGYIPHRNLIFAAVASSYDPEVVIAGVKDDNVEDKNKTAFELFSGVLSATSKQRVHVTSPFWDMTKAEVVKWFLDHVPDARFMLDISVSCYNNMAYCGKCASCFRKANALWLNGIRKKFYDQHMMLEYYSYAVNGKYVSDRNRGIIRFYEEYQMWDERG